ncbi:MAG: recombinase family protein [Planctomycetota bacterium]
MTRYLGYIRVSTDEQKQGRRAQKDAIQATADQLRGLERTPIEWFKDIGVSGATPWQKRAGLADLLLGFKKGDVLIVQRRDRLARDAVQAMMIDRMVQNGAGRIESADGARWDDSPESRLIRGILDLFSQYERDLISLRTRRALAAKRARGERLGGSVPYGMRVNAEDPSLLEVDTLAWLCIKDFIMDPHEAGVSFREIARRMNRLLQKRKFPPKYGRKWSKTTVHRIHAYHRRRLALEKAHAPA